MNPKERQEFENMKKQIADLIEARNVVFTESIRKRLLDDYIETGVAEDPDDVNVLVAATPATVAKQFSKQIEVNIGGVNYLIGVYTI